MAYGSPGKRARLKCSCYVILHLFLGCQLTESLGGVSCFMLDYFSSDFSFCLIQLSLSRMTPCLEQQPKLLMQWCWSLALLCRLCLAVLSPLHSAAGTLLSQLQLQLPLPSGLLPDSIYLLFPFCSKLLPASPTVM